MPTYYYTAFIPVKKNVYLILSPDFPELSSQGHSMEENMLMAQDAINIVVEEYTKTRKELPIPATLNQARERISQELKSLEINIEEEIIFQLIAAPAVDMTPVKISISLAKAILEIADDKAKRIGVTRSGFIANAIQAYTV